MGKVVWYLVDVCRHDTIYHSLWLAKVHGTSCCTWFCSMDGIYLPSVCLWSLRNYFNPRTRQLHKDTYSKQQTCLLWGQDILPSLQSGTFDWCLTRFPHLFLIQKETPFPPPSFPLKKKRIFSFNHQSSISRGRLTAGTLQKITHFIEENHLPNLQEAGETLTEALNTLGMAVCTGSLAASAGKAGWMGGG